MAVLASKMLETVLHTFTLSHADMAPDMDKLVTFQQIWPFLDHQMDLDAWENLEIEVLEDGTIRMLITTLEFSIDIDYNPAYLDILALADSFSITAFPGKSETKAEPFVMELTYPSIWNKRMIG